MAKKTTKRAPKNPPLYERKKTGRLVPCPGEAHDPRVGGMIDNCGICMPRWGQVEERESPLSLEQVIAACAAGFDVAVSDVARDAYETLQGAGVLTVERKQKTSYGHAYFFVYRVAKLAA